MKSFAREEKRFIMEVQMETGNYNRISDQVNREYKDRLHPDEEQSGGHRDDFDKF